MMCRSCLCEGVFLFVLWEGETFFLCVMEFGIDEVGLGDGFSCWKACGVVWCGVAISSPFLCMFSMGSFPFLTYSNEQTNKWVVCLIFPLSFLPIIENNEYYTILYYTIPFFYILLLVLDLKLCYRLAFYSRTFSYR